MQIAGSQNPPDYGRGWVRVRETPFAVEGRDQPILFRAPQGWHGPTLEAVERLHEGFGAKIFLRGNPDGVITLNWGVRATRGLNSYLAVQTSANTTAMLRDLGDLAPISFSQAEDVPVTTDWDLLVLKQDHGSHGRRKRVENISRISERDMRRWPIFQQFIPNRTEWRIHVFEHSVINAFRKIAPEGTPPTRLRVAWHFHRVQQIPRPVRWLALEANRRVGLDLSGVDVIRDEDTGRFYVLETNAAPGLGLRSLKGLYMALQHPRD